MGVRREGAKISPEDTQTIPRVTGRRIGAAWKGREDRAVGSFPLGFRVRSLSESDSGTLKAPGALRPESIGALRTKREGGRGGRRGGGGRGWNGGKEREREVASSKRNDRRHGKPPEGFFPGREEGVFPSEAVAWARPWSARQRKACSFVPGRNRA